MGKINSSHSIWSSDYSSTCTCQVQQTNSAQHKINQCWHIVMTHSTRSTTTIMLTRSTRSINNNNVDPQHKINQQQQCWHIVTYMAATWTLNYRHTVIRHSTSSILYNVIVLWWGVPQVSEMPHHLMLGRQLLERLLLLRYCLLNLLQILYNQTEVTHQKKWE